MTLEICVTGGGIEHGCWCEGRDGGLEWSDCWATEGWCEEGGGERERWGRAHVDECEERKRGEARRKERLTRAVDEEVRVSERGYI